MIAAMITTAIAILGLLVASLGATVGLLARHYRDLSDRVLVLEGKPVREPGQAEEVGFNIHRDFFAPTGTDPR